MKPISRLALLIIVGSILLAAHADDAKPPVATTVNVREQGAIGDGKADDTAAIQRAIATCPAGGVVYLSAGHYRVSATLTIAKPLTLRGDGAYTYYQGMFGDGAYSTSTEPGTVIESAIATGAVIEHIESSEPLLNVRVSDLQIKGLGDATRTTVGLRIGSATRSGYCTLRGVRVSNLKVGVALTNVQDSSVDDLWVYGCDTGLDVGAGSIANVFSNFNAGGCGDSVALAGAKNVFLGGAIQSSTRTGITVLGEENSIRDVYFESAQSLYAIDVMADATTIDACHFGGDRHDNVRIGAAACRLLGAKYAQRLTITPRGNMTQVIGNWSGPLDDQGNRTCLIAQLLPVPPPPPKHVMAQAAIPRGRTSVTVEHGLGGQPIPEDVAVTLWSATRVWLGGVDDKALTFRIEKAAPVGGVTFTWSASLR